jgi:phosphoribosylaminoimidazole-succinocarboxamide synthase
MSKDGAVRWGAAADTIVDQCEALDIKVRITGADRSAIDLAGPVDEPIRVWLDGRATMIEQVLQQLRFDFKSLPALTTGESKEIRLLTQRVALAKLLPTVYSFTHRRYGVAPGTDEVRARFSADLFRLMQRNPGNRHLATAFLGLVESPEGPLLAEHVVEPGNIEVRVKRYHIGSPTHRYRFIEDYPTAGGGLPLQKWQRFDRPLVCFDWRHPLEDEKGTALADEPLPDDYATLWLDDLPAAKRLARETFEWIEELFASKGLRLIDICFFVDRVGHVIFGEISPDCMRVRSAASDQAEALDKDEWRSGGEASSVLERYTRLHSIVFGELNDQLAA